MSTIPRLYISSYRNQAVDDFGRMIPAPMAPALAEAYVEITHQSLMSDPFPRWTSFICLKAEADCSIAFAMPGQEVEADPDYAFVEAGERLFFGVAEGYRIAVIAAI